MPAHRQRDGRSQAALSSLETGSTAGNPDWHLWDRDQCQHLLIE